MSGFNHCLLSLCISACILCSCTAWYVKLPRYITGLRGSCLVIPCSFDYYQYPPKRPHRVVWYQYKNHGYPLVHDDWYPSDVIWAFRGKTEVYTYGRKCTLLIDPVTDSHHSQKIYPWVDPENVGKSTYRFYDTTVTIQVEGSANDPHIMITGDMRVGQSVTVQCTIYHTCSIYPPTLSLNIPLKSHSLVHSSLSDGTSKTTLTTILSIEKDKQTVRCSARHRGGIYGTAQKTLNAQCSIFSLTISTASYEFLEGVARTVTCTSSYTCPKQAPTLTWNYGGMSASTIMTKSGTNWLSVSTLRFTASAGDDGRSLICYAVFTGGQRQETRITLRVKRNMMARDWSFTTPRSITGMKGSCIVIPCTFTYKTTQPAGLQVKWYLYSTNAYPPVFDTSQSVVSKFSGRTSVIGSVTDRNCSLKVEKLEMTHNQDRVYPWIDQYPVTSFHTQGSAFYDKTTQIIVSDKAQEPQLNIIGIPRVGEQSTVSCSVQHKCIFAPPVLTLSGVNGQDNLKDTLVSDGTWERSVERTWSVREEDRSVKCSVSYSGGQKAESGLELNVECPNKEIKMVQRVGEATEGVAKSVICSVDYKCKKNMPNITWNYEYMQSNSSTKKNSVTDTYTTVSNLTFIGSLEDNDQLLTCTARFVSAETSDSETLKINKYEPQIEEIDAREHDTLWSADVPYRFSALTRSCVVIPCHFQYQADTYFSRGVWAKKTGGVIYHNGRSNILDHFKDRTKILGDLNEGNCTLEIDDIKPFDNGPFCFYGEIENVKHRFTNSCVFIIMRASPEKPVMTTVPAEVNAGSALTVSCSVTHTCSTHHPEFSWNVAVLTNKVTHSMTARGVWETTSAISFIVAVGDGARNLSCTANFWRNKKQARTANLNVKGSTMYQFRSALPVVIPVVLILTTLSAVLGVVIYKKRDTLRDRLSRMSLWDRLTRRRTEDRQKPPPRPEKRGSIWSRLSGRRTEDRQKPPPRPEKRRSIWSRLSRHQANTADFSVGYSNNTTTLSFDGKPPRPKKP